MMRILQIGCGALGQMLAQATLDLGHVLTIARRSGEKFSERAQVLQMDIVSGEGVSALHSLEVDVVIYCVAPLSSDVAEYRRTYVEGLRNILSALTLSHVQHVFFVSSTRVYGQNQGEWVGDDTPAIPADTGGQILLEAEQLCHDLPCGTTALRLSGIYGPGRRYLFRMAQQPASWPQQATWTNRIHEQDVVGAVMHLYTRLSQGIALPSSMIISDGQPALQHEVLQWIAEKMQWPLPTTPPLMPQSGKRLLSQHLQACGYRLNFEGYKTGYASVLQAINQ